jgi:hypothetical protein
MNEHQIERGLAQLRETWRVAGPPPLDRMWEAIEPSAFTAPGRTPTRWLRTLLPLAAMLVIGFGIGRIAPAPDRASAGGLVEADLPALPAAASNEARPFVGVATDYLERVTALLFTLAGESSRGQPVEYKASQAKDLLATTRLLMDSPDPIEPQLRVLLEDLELVLAQIARLPARPEAPDVYLIDQALDQREVIPRLRVYLAETPTSQP